MRRATLNGVIGSEQNNAGLRIPLWREGSPRLKRNSMNSPLCLTGFASRPAQRCSGALYGSLFCAVVASALPAVAEEEYSPGVAWPTPPVVSPGSENGSPPSDAIVLFDGEDLQAWDHAESWEIADGVTTVGDRSIETKQRFGDCQLHVEWSIPADAGSGDGQSRGNSGVYFMPHFHRENNQHAKYELQILDSYQRSTYPDGQAGAIYKQRPPMVNAMRPPGEWNTYDVVFVAPRFDASGVCLSPAYLTAFHNGVLIHHHQPLTGATSWNKPPKYSRHGQRLPIGIQAHWSRVGFRNIWVREIAPIVGRQVEPPSYYNRKTKQKRPALDAAPTVEATDR